MRLNSFKKFLVFGSTFFILSFMFFSVVFADAQTKDVVSIRMDGIVPVCVKNGQDVPCESFDHLIVAIKNIIDFVTQFVLMFVVVIIAVAGWKYMTSGDNAGKRTEANKMFIKVAWGLFYILGAWLIVTLITNAILRQDLGIIQILK